MWSKIKAFLTYEIFPPLSESKKQNLHNLTDVFTLMAAMVFGLAGNAPAAIGLVAMYMAFQVLEYTISEW